MEIQLSILDEAFYIVEHGTSVSYTSAMLDLDSEHLPVHMTLSSESPFLRR